MAFLVAEALMSCGTDQHPNDGINEEAARESESRRTYGTEPSWEKGHDTVPIKEHDTPERLSTEGDNGQSKK